MTIQRMPQTTTADDVTLLPTAALWRVSVEKYHEIIASGVLTEDDDIELLEGWLVRKMPKRPQHSVITRLLFDRLTQLLPPGWFVNMQEPITTEDSEPEPDLSVVRGTPHDYFTHHPGPEDVALLVEVSDTTLSQDKALKKRLYAAVHIPVYWIVNLPDEQIEVYSHPVMGTAGADYGQRQTFGPNDSVPVTIAGQTTGEIPVADLLPT